MTLDTDTYAEPGAMTRIIESPALTELPSDVAGVTAVTQGLIIHEFWAQAYDVALAPERLDDLQQRSVAQMIERMLTLDSRPLAAPRPPERRMVGNCRFFSTFACALLRRAGTPARARCGFGAYFESGKYIDHWIVEHWDGTRWVQTDAQLDALQQNTLQLSFDPLDMPPGQFLTGGEAWARCRRGALDPARFGILDMWGLWFVRGNAIRDLAALNRVEVLPWDGWGVMNETGHSDLAPDDPVNLLVDEIAAVTARDDHDEIRALYEKNDGLRVPAEVFDYRLGITVPVPV
jgi:hypothetical protein